MSSHRERFGAEEVDRGVPRPRAPRVPGATRAQRGRATPRRSDSLLARLTALGLVGAFAVIGPLVEGTVGGGRGLALGFLLMVIAPSLVRAGGMRLHPLDPETFVPCAYFLSAGYAPLLHLFLSEDFTLSYAEVQAFQVAYLGSVGCAAICTGFSRIPQDLATAAPSLPTRLLPRDWAVIATGLVGASLVGVWIASVGVGTLLRASYGDTYNMEEGKGVLVAGWYFIQLALNHCVARIADFRLVHKPVPRVLYTAVGVMLVVFLMNTMLGRRGPLLWLLLAMALCMHLSGVRIRRIWMAVAACFVVVYAFAVEGYRTELGQGADASFAAAQQGIERIENPFVIPELEVVFRNLVVVVNEKPPIVHYPGESWINALLILIPKPVWPDRPVGMSLRYVAWLSPSIAREGGGYAFSATAEGFVNLGEVGALLEISALTLTFFFLPLALCLHRRRDPLLRAVACCMASFAYNQFRGELAGLLKIVFTFLFAAVVVHLASAIFKYMQGQFRKPPPRVPGLEGARGRRGEVYRRAPAEGALAPAEGPASAGLRPTLIGGGRLPRSLT